MRIAAAAHIAAASIAMASLAGCGSEDAPLAEAAHFGQRGTGATSAGTAGGGTLTTNKSFIGSGSYGSLPEYAQAVTPSSVSPLSGPGFATAPAVEQSAFLPVAPGAAGTAVRDHSFAAHVNSPGPGGKYRPNSIPSREVTSYLPTYHASPEARSVPTDVPPRDADAPAAEH